MRSSRPNSAIPDRGMVNCHAGVADGVDSVSSFARTSNDKFNASIRLRHGLVNDLQDLRCQCLMPAVVTVEVQSPRLEFPLRDLEESHLLIGSPNKLSYLYG